MKHKKVDAIISYSVVNSGLSGIRLARKYDVPIFFRNIDMLHRLNGAAMIRRIVEFFERRVYRRVDRVLALTPKYADYLIDMGASPNSVDILPFPVEVAGPNGSSTRPSGPAAEIVHRWAEESRQIVVFVGHFYEFSGIAEFVRHVPSILADNPNMRLLLVGDGPLRAEVEGTIDELELAEYVNITGLLPFETMPFYIGSADVCINPYPVEGDMKDLFSAKVIQYLSCGKAAVSAALPGMTTMIPGESCGVVYVESAEEMAQAVSALLRSAARREELGAQDWITSREYILGSGSSKIWKRGCWRKSPCEAERDNTE